MTKAAPKKHRTFLAPLLALLLLVISAAASYADTTSKQYFYGGNVLTSPLIEIDSATEQVQYNIYATGGNGPDATYISNTGEIAYVTKNHRTDSSLYTDKSGEVLDGIVYDEFGEPSLILGNQVVKTIPYRYGGHEYDASIALYDYGYRYYGEGRFLSTDPAGASISPYVAFADNAVNLTDPDGALPVGFSSKFFRPFSRVTPQIINQSIRTFSQNEPPGALITFHKGTRWETDTGFPSYETFHADITTYGERIFKGMETFTTDTTFDEYEAPVYEDTISDLRTHFIGGRVITHSIYQTNTSRSNIPLTQKGVEKAQAFQKSEILSTEKTGRGFNRFGLNSCDMHCLQVLMETGEVPGSDLGGMIYAIGSRIYAKEVYPSYRQAFWLAYKLDINLWAGGSRWPGGADPIFMDAYEKIIKNATHQIDPNALKDANFWDKVYSGVQRDINARSGFFQDYLNEKNSYGEYSEFWKNMPDFSSETQKVLQDHLVPVE